MRICNSALIVVLFAVGACVVVFAAYASYALYRAQMGPSQSLLATNFGLPPASGDGARGQSHAAHSIYARALLERANTELRALHASLEETRESLTQQTTSLQQKNAECRSLQRELDQTIDFVCELLADETLAYDQPLTAEILLQREQAKDKLESELAALRSELSKSDFLEQEQAVRLEELQTELIRAEAEIASIQMSAQAEITGLLLDRQAFESVATQVLVQAGSALVPALIELLGDDRPDIRAWSAFVLGEIGPEARSASAALTSLLIDSDEDVRRQAQAALARVDGVTRP